MPVLAEAPKYFWIASSTADSEATTGSTLYPVMNLMSSMANTLVGSVIAMVSVAPLRLTGTTWYFCAVSTGTSLITAASISKSARLIDGTPYCRLKTAMMSSLFT